MARVGVLYSRYARARRTAVLPVDRVGTAVEWGSCAIEYSLPALTVHRYSSACCGAAKLYDACCNSVACGWYSAKAEGLRAAATLCIALCGYLPLHCAWSVGFAVLTRACCLGSTWRLHCCTTTAARSTSACIACQRRSTCAARPYCAHIVPSRSTAAAKSTQWGVPHC